MEEKKVSIFEEDRLMRVEEERIKRVEEAKIEQLRSMKIKLPQIEENGREESRSPDKGMLVLKSLTDFDYIRMK